MRFQRGALAVLVLGVAVTIGLAIGAELSYRHNQRRLTSLQTRLTALALDSAPVEFERRLGQVAGVVAYSTDPSRDFRRLLAPSMKPSGPFASASLIQLNENKPTLLVHLGTPPIRQPTGAAATALYRRAANTRVLVTTRGVAHGIQKLGYLMAASGSAGTFVVSGAQSLPLHKILPVAPSSPDAGLNIAIYFGSATNPSDLVASTSARLPTGLNSKASVPFGTSRLTVVASARTSLAGTLAEVLPAAVAIAGLLMTIIVALLVERLIRRRHQAEDLAARNDLLYQQQRDVALELQRSLLPSKSPLIEGVETAAAYVPGASGTAIGGDWYSIVQPEERCFYFVVGDVSGRGIEAAALMAQLRFTIRTLAMLSQDPADILEHTSKTIDLEASEHFATVLVGRVDDNHTVTIATAGHFPPLLLDGKDGEFATINPGTPLGVQGSGYQTVTMPIAPGTTIIAFTDGLVETRSASLEQGLERLRVAATAIAGSEIDALVSGITDQLIPSGSEDDVAVLAIRFTPTSEPAVTGATALST